MGEIKYPIEVSGIEAPAIYRDHHRPWTLGAKCGDLVQVRSCCKEDGTKTYLGILLGDLPLDISFTHNRETKKLEIYAFKNPAIYVPELRKILWGVESWWEDIDSEDQLRQISDDDIQNVWYVKLWKEMQARKVAEAAEEGK